MNLALAPEAEQRLLGHMLADNERYHQASNITASDFAGDANRRIYAAIADLIEGGESADLFAVQQRLAQRKELDRIGGVRYLSILNDHVDSASSLSSVMKQVREAS